MAFMRPEYTNEAFVEITPSRGDSEVMPRDVMSDEQIRDAHGDDCEIETITGKWWARLSASGYLDCTLWSGPHDTREAARKALSEMYDVDPDTGDDLDACSAEVPS